MGPGVHDQPEHADRHGQPGDRRPRLRAGPGRGLPRALQHLRSCSAAPRRARCASTCSATPTCWPSWASSTTPSTTGRTTVAEPIIAAGPGRRRLRGGGRRLGGGQGGVRPGPGRVEPAHQQHRRDADAGRRGPRARLQLRLVRDRPRLGDPARHRPAAGPGAAPAGARPDERAGGADPAGRRRLPRPRDRPGRPTRDPEPRVGRRPDARDRWPPRSCASSAPAPGSSSAAPSWPAPTPISSSSPTSRRTTSPSRCARSPTSASSSSVSTPTSSTTRPASTSTSWSTAPSGCRR